MMKSLFSGVAGLKTHQSKMDVIGNNIANVNTTAFKSTSTTFQDVMYQTMSNASGGTSTKGGVNARQIGLGVTTAANKISITTQGSSEATGDGLDLRLVDKQSTNFFIVSDGSSNLFTRAGSFYVDGNGNLAMTSTGYLVQGWQVDSTASPKTIKRDTVSPLKVMSAEHKTSDPEQTTKAYASGIVDANDSNVTGTSGHIMSLTFYDSLGYAYTAKFNIKSGENKSGTDGNVSDNGFTIELNSITSDSKTNSNGVPFDLYDEYVTNKVSPTSSETDILKAQSELFGSASGVSVDSYQLDASQYTVEKNGGNFIIKTGTGTDQMTATLTGTSIGSGDINSMKITFSGAATSTSVSLATVFPSLSSVASNYSGKQVDVSFDYNTQSLKVKSNAATYDMYFNTSNGTFHQLSARTDKGEESKGTSVTLNVTKLGKQFTKDITIDFSTLLNYDNGGSSTAGLNRGTVSDGSDGAGKKIGQMTGLTIQNDGQIFASYSNGNTELLGQIPVARFANASGLESLGNNCYQTTLNSGSFDGIGQEITSDGSSMNSGYLEMSNVDLAQEFTQMITTQRGFQANSRIITVSDTMLEELTNLKR
ncbi:MAG: flagellar hook-basal body complex protein [Lachnospiraceae bacterium]|nr:MAG: flagellar hook-basal body complex protein [Lachnospiraceae bacterium]